MRNYYTVLEAVPSNTVWSGSIPVPQIGDRIFVNFNGFGYGMVDHYFTEDGYLGVIVTLEKHPEWHKKQNPGIKTCGAFGREINAIEICNICGKEYPASQLQPGQCLCNKCQPKLMVANG
jgi:hypothetical protein